MRILVTGGTGHLGQEVVSGLIGEGILVRVLAREPRGSSEIEQIKGDLATGDGVREAVADVDAVIHAATNSPAAQRGRFTLGDLLHSPADVDVDGTRALLDAAGRADVKHFIHISILGLEHVKQMPYARRKLEAEQLVRNADVPSSIVRATGFYWLLERMFANMLRRRMLMLPAKVRMAPVDSREFARFIVERITDGHTGRREGFAGPQTLTMIELMQQYLAARGEQRRIRHAPLPTGLQASLTAGNVASANARLGTTTWRQWLHEGSQAPHPEGGFATRPSTVIQTSR